MNIGSEMTIAEMIVEALAEYGVSEFWGVVGDALNPVVDPIRREDRIEWVGVRHEEAGAFAASAQAQLTGRLAVCMGTVGPGAIHLLNGLYDAKKSHARRCSRSVGRCRRRRSARVSSRRSTTTRCSVTSPSSPRR
ncbi:thiamine pyrophosphate-binding protein [Dermacoccus nishinomiyaensis]|uniref:thiamine pyrophosphate-binding protein n=1 Tax=Dermacoccus nishinomiyaensis TaxID=1274 RepID=UPI0030D55096